MRAQPLLPNNTNLKTDFSKEIWWGGSSHSRIASKGQKILLKKQKCLPLRCAWSQRNPDARFSLASNAYHAGNISGLQRFSLLSAERPQSMHWYCGLLAKIFISSESESGGNSQIFLANWSSDCFSSDIGHLIWHKRPPWLASQSLTKWEIHQSLTMKSTSSQVGRGSHCLRQSVDTPCIGNRDC
jgi:hypothetical protein